MFADRSEGEMTALLDAVCENVYEGFADLDTFAKYTVKNQIMPMMAACIDVLDAQPHHGSKVEIEWNVLDNGEPYLQPWTDEDDARSYSNVVTGPLVHRTRTTCEPVTSEWSEI